MSFPYQWDLTGIQQNAFRGSGVTLVRVTGRVLSDISQMEAVYMARTVGLGVRSDGSKFDVTIRLDDGDILVPASADIPSQ